MIRDYVKNPIFWIGVVMFVFLVGIPLVTNIPQPDAVQDYQTGIDALSSYLDDPAGNIVPMFRFFFIPFLFVWALIYGVLDAGVARFFEQRVTVVMSLLLATAALFSHWFLEIVTIVNIGGALGLIVFALIGLFFGGWITYEEWSWEKKTTQQALFEEEKEWQEEAEDMNDQMYTWLNSSLNNGGLAAHDDEFRQAAEEVITLALGAPDKISEHASTLREILGRDNDQHAVKYDQKLVEHAQEKEKLARKYKKFLKKEQKAVQGSL